MEGSVKLEAPEMVVWPEEHQSRRPCGCATAIQSAFVCDDDWDGHPRMK